MQGAGDESERGRLAWRCRRGMKELDLLLRAWLDGEWSGASKAEREAFEQILDLPDPVLAAYLLGHAHCAEEHLAPLLAFLQRLAARPASGPGPPASRSPG